MQHLPRKRYLGNNFDPAFLEDRCSGLQTLVDNILRETDLLNTELIQEFFCFNEPPICSESNEESRVRNDFHNNLFHFKLLHKTFIVDSY